MLTRLYGITGMSIAVLLTISIITPFLMRKLKRVLDVRYILIFRDPLLVAGITLTAGWGLVWVTHPVGGGFFLDFLAIAVIYILLVLMIMGDLGRETLTLVKTLLPKKNLRVYAEMWGKNWTGGQLELEYTANQPKEIRYEKAPTAAPAL